ncbi:carbamoyl phosphate synthase small subunit [Helcococcus kunzii]
MEKLRYLVLEDGQVFEGKAFGSDNFTIGELVSNSSMTGYQEILSDNSYVGKIINLTYPMIGSYGITREGFENTNPYIFGLIVGEYTQVPSNWKSEMTLDEYLKLKNIPAIEGLDTRMLSKIINKNHCIKATFTDSIENVEEIVKELKEYKSDENYTDLVSIKKPFRIPNNGEKIVVIDLGASDLVVRELNFRGKDITIVPYNFTSEEIMRIHPKGIVISNGPGNLKQLNQLIESVKRMIGKLPIFGIGLGHQVIALASGADIKLLDKAQRGSNYPVKNIENNHIENVVKNNHLTVDEKSLENTGLEITHIDVNVGNIEGLKDDSKMINSIQYQPYYIASEKVDSAFEKFYNNINELMKEECLENSEGEINA